MDTPIYDFIKGYIESGFSRLHVPGHKGVPFLGFEEQDITEIKGADALYGASGIIARSEENASTLFGTKRSFYATEGSSLCIKAMLYTAMINADCPSGRPVVLAARNAHKAFVFACALLDLDVDWLYPERGTPTSICSCVIGPDTLDRKLSSMENPPFAVYVTSPDYLGGLSDISGLSRVCRKYRIPLIVDNAHGAYLKFLPESRHPIDQGAAMCCDSAHKTLPVLTGGAYLHVSKDADARYTNTVRSAMDMFGSTSPSYLILESLDLCNKYLAEGYNEKLAACVGRIAQHKAALAESGCAVRDSEPLKLVIDAHQMGLSGYTLSDILREHHVECEYCDADSVVLMFTPENKTHDYSRIWEALSVLPAGKTPADTQTGTFPRTKPAMTIRGAVFSKHERVSPEASFGRICGCPAVSCPPAVPIAVSGEIITEEMAQLFKETGISEVEVVCI